jgi:hypothetical protein
LDDTADGATLDTAANGFNFWQLRHGVSRNQIAVQARLVRNESIASAAACCSAAFFVRPLPDPR